MASAILFLEHHDHQTIWEDIDYAISLEPDYLQFMQLGPMPGTALYERLRAAGEAPLRRPLRGAARAGPHLVPTPRSSPARRPARCCSSAFARDYRTNGASLLRAITTALMGYRYALAHADPRIRARAADFADLLRRVRSMLLASRVFSSNAATDALLRELSRAYREDFAGRV